MPARIGAKITFPGWISLWVPRWGYVDLFVFPVSHRMGLPPGAAANLVTKVFRKVRKQRQRATLWVPVIAPGSCFLKEFQARLEMRYWNASMSYAITEGRPPGLDDFNFRPPYFRDDPPWPPRQGERPEILHLPLSQQHALVRMGYLRKAFTKEVAADLDVTPRWTRTLLNRLVDAGYVKPTKRKKQHAWKLARRGVAAVRRAWGIPPGVSVKGERELKKNAMEQMSERHLRTSRLWPAWLRDTYWVDEIWAGWSEVHNLITWLGPKQFDGLALGTYRGRETVFVVEVEAGNKSRREIRDWYKERVELIARNFHEHLVVFVLLAQRWTLRQALKADVTCYNHVALLFQDWKNYGELPSPSFGARKSITLYKRRRRYWHRR